MSDEQSLVASLFTLIEDTMFQGDRLQSSEFVTMMSPGQFVSLNLQEGNRNDEYIQYDVTNDCLDTSFLRNPLQSTIGGKYEEIFTFAALPLKSLSPAQQAELAADTNQVNQLQDAYNQYKSAFDDADGDYQAALTNPNTDPTVLQQLYNARQRAQQEWDTSGKRQAFETAYSDFLYLQSSDPRSYWQTLDQKRKQFKLTSARGDYFRTLFNPAVADWPKASWTHAVLDTRTVSSSSYSRSTQWSGGLSVGWGLWSFGGNGGHSETYNHDHSEITNLSADLEYLRVKIMRPWVLTDVFTYRFWTWSKTHGFVYISDGGNLLANPPVRPIGAMPFYPEEFVVVRNVKLTASFTQTDNQVITSHNSGGASFGLGPFSISGSYSEDTQEVDTSGTFDGATITITQPQIIAFLGSLTARCPDPDLTLPWQPDAAFPNSMTSATLKELRDRRSADFKQRAKPVKPAA
jgi:hypothetical protein